MGNSTPSEQQQTMSSQQRQIVDQNYSNNIMFISFSTLEAICFKLLGKDVRSVQKMFSYYDKTDYTTKTISQLLSQFQVHLLLFKTSKIDMEKKYQEGFIFPDQFPKQRALKLLDYFQKICQSNNTLAYKFCQDFKAILNNQYQNLSFENQTIDAKELPNNPKELIQKGIWAGNEMDKLKEQTLQQGVSKAQKLKVNIKQPQYDYQQMTRKK